MRAAVDASVGGQYSGVRQVMQTTQTDRAHAGTLFRLLSGRASVTGSLLQASSHGATRVVVHDLQVGLVEARGQVRLSRSQTDRVGDALAERACACAATPLSGSGMRRESMGPTVGPCRL